MRLSNLTVVLFVSVLGFLLVAPVPAHLLDFVIVANLSFSILLLISSLLAIEISSLMIFPTIILVLTLLRIATNIATTRMILTQGYAGEVIDAFGRVLIQGDVIVGLIIFSLISLVCLVVISRGSLRISEVAARFTLDALPARQLAIEQELKLGSITFKQAELQREELKRESMLFGSIEGSMKFIQGDAIISVVAVIVNLLGGIYIGMRDKLTFQQALDKYTVLTVGDGLVAQVPALFLALSAGIIVSRVSSVSRYNVVQQISTQFFARPETLLVTAIVIIALGFMPGVPLLPFVALGGSLGVLGLLANRRSISKAQSKLVETEFFGKTEAILAIPQGVQVDLKKLTEFECLVREFLNRLVGIPMPMLKITQSVEPYATLVVQNRKFKLADLGPKKMLVNLPIYYLEIFKEKDAIQANVPILNLKGLVVTETIKMTQLIKSLGCESFSNEEYLILRAFEEFICNPDTIIDVGTTSILLRQIVRNTPAIQEIIESNRFLSPTKLSELLKMFIKKRISISNMVLLIEAINNLCLKYNQSKFDEAISTDDIFAMLMEQYTGYLLVPFEEVFAGRLIPSISKGSINLSDYQLSTFALKRVATLPSLFIPAHSDSQDDTIICIDHLIPKLRKDFFCNIVGG